jgi:hypothetical protein
MKFDVFGLLSLRNKDRVQSPPIDRLQCLAISPIFLNQVAAILEVDIPGGLGDGRFFNRFPESNAFERLPSPEGKGHGNGSAFRNIIFSDVWSFF